MATDSQTPSARPFALEVRDDGESFAFPSTVAAAFSSQSTRETPVDREGGQVIAHLIPDSESAIQALIRVKSSQPKHAQYLVSLPHPLNNGPSPTDSIWAYAITTSNLMVPDEAQWRIGRGHGRLHLRGVELLLCSPRDKNARKHISDFHGQFFPHEQSGVWMFRNTSPEHTVTYISGQPFRDMIVAKNDTVVLWMQQNRLRFGPYQFLFEFTREHESLYLNIRNEHLLSLPSAVVSCHLDPLPRDTHRRTNNYVLHDNIIAVNHDRSTRVLAGVDVHKGNAIAVKQYIIGVERDGPCHRSFLVHITAMIDFQDTPTGILAHHRDWSDGGIVESVAMPLAVADFGSFDFRGVSWTTQLRLYHQTLQGLATIHARGFMHRAIRPGHLLVLSADPESPSAAICDFGLAIRATTATDADTKQAHTVAPEAWSDEPFMALVDVWGLAYSWLLALAPRGSDERNPADSEGPITRDRHAAIMAFIDEATAPVTTHDPAVDTVDAAADHTRHEFGVLLKSMLAWEPEDRMSAEEALKSHVWEGVVVTVDTVDDDDAVDDDAVDEVDTMNAADAVSVVDTADMFDPVDTLDMMSAVDTFDTESAVDVEAEPEPGPSRVRGGSPPARRPRIHKRFRPRTSVRGPARKNRRVGGGAAVPVGEDGDDNVFEPAAHQEGGVVDSVEKENEGEVVPGRNPVVRGVARGVARRVAAREAAAAAAAAAEADAQGVVVLFPSRGQRRRVYYLHAEP